MRVFGTSWNGILISCLGSPSQKGWLRSLEKEDEKLSRRIQEATEAETATLFARRVAPLIRSLTKEYLCASPLPDLVNRQKENRQLLDRYKQQLGSSLVLKSLYTTAAFAAQMALLLAASSLKQGDSRPSITKPEGWELYTPVQKSEYIHQFMTKQGLVNYASQENSFSKVHMHNRYIKPLLASDQPLYKSCRKLLRTIHPDHLGRTQTGTDVSGFVTAFCPRTKSAQQEFFNT